MKDNKIAKELLRIAKELCAINEFQNKSGVEWVDKNITRSQGQFLKLLQTYIQLRRLFFYLLTNDPKVNNIEYAKKKLRTVRVIQNLSNISADAAVFQVEDQIEELKKILSNTNKNDSLLRKIQDSILKLMKTREELYVAFNKDTGVQVVLIDDARNLLSRINDMLHSFNIKKLNIQKVTPTRENDEQALNRMIEMLKKKGVRFQNNLGKQKGDQNFGVYLQDIKTQRPRIAKAIESLKKATDEMRKEGREEKVSNNIHAFLTSSYEYIQGFANEILGYFSTIHTSTLSTMLQNRQDEGLIKINKDISPVNQSGNRSGEFEKIIGIGHDFEALKDVLMEKVINSSKQKQAFFKLIDILTVNGKYKDRLLFLYRKLNNLEENQLIDNDDYNKFTDDICKKSSSLNKQQKMLLKYIKENLPKFYEKLKEIQSNDMGSFKGDLTLEQLNEIYKENDAYNKLEIEQKKALLNWINEHKETILSIENRSEQLRITKIAGLNIKDIVEGVSSFYESVKQKLEKFYDKIVGNNKIQENNEKLKSLIKEENSIINEQIDVINLIEQTDKRLINLYNQLENAEDNQNFDISNFNNRFEQMDKAASRKK